MTRVAVVVLSYNQDAFVGECLDSVTRQEGVELEVIVADHGSARASRERTERAARERGFRFLALDRQRTVAHARSRAVEATSAPLVHTLDADNMLMPGGVAYLADLLDRAPADVGFAYPRLTYFTDGIEWERPVPAFNLYALLLGNFCDTGGLYRRECFAGGLPDVPFHEDWAFALRLAARGVRGVAAEQQTVRLRRHGFTRSQRAAARPDRLRLVAESAAELYDPGEFRRIKSHWAPALSVVASPAGAPVQAMLAKQSCSDAEIVTEADAARGRFLFLTGGNACELLARRELCEQLLRLFLAAPDTQGLVLAAGAGNYPLEPLSGCDPHDVVAVGLAGDLRHDSSLLGRGTLAACAELLLSRTDVQVRGWTALDTPRGEMPASVLPALPPEGPERVEHEFRSSAAPLLPGAPVGAAALEPRDVARWAPRDSIRLFSFLDGREHRVGTHDLVQPGIVEGELGLLSANPMTGGVALALTPDGRLRRCEAPADALGYAEPADLSGMDELVLASFADEPPFVTVSRRPGPRATKRLAFVEPPDPHPVAPARLPVRAGRAELTRVVGDQAHRYAVHDAADEPVRGARLGRCLGRPAPGSLPLAGRLPPRPRRAARMRKLPTWVLAPLRWRGLAPGRRLGVVRWRVTHLGPVRARPPEVWLFPEDAPRRVALYAAWHRATGDLLLTTDAHEPARLGYGTSTRVGWLEHDGEPGAEADRAPRPWCWREGLE